MVEPKQTQKQQVLQLLRERGATGLTALESLELIGTMRLAAYVKFLKDDGFTISTEIIEVPSGKHVALYRLVGEPGPAVVKPRAYVAPGFLFDVSKDAQRA